MSNPDEAKAKAHDTVKALMVEKARLPSLKLTPEAAALAAAIIDDLIQACAWSLVGGKR